MKKYNVRITEYYRIDGIEGAVEPRDALVETRKSGLRGRSRLVDRADGGGSVVEEGGEPFSRVVEDLGSPPHFDQEDAEILKVFFGEHVGIHPRAETFESIGCRPDRAC